MTSGRTGWPDKIRLDLITRDQDRRVHMMSTSIVLWRMMMSFLCMTLTR